MVQFPFIPETIIINRKAIKGDNTFGHIRDGPLTVSQRWHELIQVLDIMVLYFVMGPLLFSPRENV